jgi:cyanophycinase
MMSGPIGLHGGGEYLAGDEPFLDALLAAAARAAEHQGSSPNERIRIVVVPTAASRGLPDRAAATGVEAFERRADAAGLPVLVKVARIVDAASAWDPNLVAAFVTADLIHLPGGDPDLIPAILAGTAALAAIRHAWERGAVLAGASAGAMALAEWTWTPRGGMHGLGFVRGLAVVPHYNEVRRTTWQASIDELAPGGIGYLGLDERTGVLAESNGSGDRTWMVAGPGAAWWFARNAAAPLVARDGETLRIPD